MVRQQIPIQATLKSGAVICSSSLTLQSIAHLLLARDSSQVEIHRHERCCLYSQAVLISLLL